MDILNSFCSSHIPVPLWDFYDLLEFLPRTREQGKTRAGESGESGELGEQTKSGAGESGVGELGKSGAGKLGESGAGELGESGVGEPGEPREPGKQGEIRPPDPLTEPHHPTKPGAGEPRELGGGESE